MLNLLKNFYLIAKYSKKAQTPGWVWIVVALIIAAAVIIGIYIYTEEKPKPFWETD